MNSNIPFMPVKTAPEPHVSSSQNSPRLPFGVRNQNDSDSKGSFEKYLQDVKSKDRPQDRQSPRDTRAAKPKEKVSAKSDASQSSDVDEIKISEDAEVNTAPVAKDDVQDVKQAEEAVSAQEEIDPLEEAASAAVKTQVEFKVIPFPVTLDLTAAACVPTGDAEANIGGQEIAVNVDPLDLKGGPVQTQIPEKAVPVDLLQEKLNKIVSELKDGSQKTSLDLKISDLTKDSKIVDLPLQNTGQGESPDLTQENPEFETRDSSAEKLADIVGKVGKKLSPVKIAQFSQGSDGKMEVSTAFSKEETVSMAQLKLQTLGTQSFGIKNATKEAMPETATSPNQPEVMNFSTVQAANIRGANPALKAALTEPVPMSTLIDRVQQAINSQPPPTPRHLVLQLNPPSLGLLQLDVRWSAQGWNVNCSVAHRETHEWLAQQLPVLQQQHQNSDAPIIWNAPTLNQFMWDMNRQQNQHAHQEGTSFAGGYLPDEEIPVEEKSERKKKANEFWA